ncbi:MAG TPA: hypothetical protein PLD54_00035 [Candidatus Levybacteria bacterium]|nr:hypothetical protein [Candidatus Levybacteria bacterium]
MATSTKKSSKKTVQKSDKTSSSSFVTRIKSIPSKVKLPAINRFKLLLVLGIAVVVALLYFFQDVYLFAKINGKPLTTMAVMKEMEQVKQNEISEVVNIMIDKTLILQEAENRNIVIPDSEIDQEIQKTEAQLQQSGQSLDSQLVLLGLTREGLRENYRIQKSIEKMLGQAEVTDKEIDAYLEENKDIIPEEQEEAELRAMVKEQLSQQKLGEKYQAFITDLRNKANITTFRPYLNQAPVSQ